ncbi:hypothetical protein EYF80_002167 [Liparis tanakae]|uniref:Uncharacterized protein n=1 Tax=Liparis tanakae TaxID=230148 RepID=A0A4Z2JBE2_9TELE|nr:hypothetical protein EYF80_002167 [Liparis tanakae]
MMNTAPNEPSRGGSACDADRAIRLMLSRASSSMFILVGLVGGGGALGRRHNAGWEGDGGCFPRTPGQGGVGTDMERIPGPSRNQARGDISEYMYR